MFSSSRIETLLVFRLGPERFGVRLADVHEVIELPPVKSLPDASPALLGVARLGDELVTVYDPRIVLEAGGSDYEFVLLFVDEGRRIGVAIHDVFDPVVVEADDLEATLGMDRDRVLRGVVRRGADLIGVLDARALVAAVAERTTASAVRGVEEGI